MVPYVAPSTSDFERAVAALQKMSLSDNKSQQKRKNKPKAPKKAKQSRGAALSSSANVGNAIGTITRFPQPSVTNVASGQVVTHTELICNVSLARVAGSAVPYAVLTTGGGKLSLNPGLPQILPYLSAIASNYEQYKFRRARLTYTPCVASTTAGSINLGFIRDAAESDTATLGELLNLPFAAQANIWSPLSVDLPVSRTPLYVRTGALPTNQSLDIKTYDVGVMQVALSNLPAAASTALETYGVLTLSYEVELTRQHYSRAIQARLNSAQITSAGALTLTTPFGASNGTQSGGMFVRVSGGSVFTCTPGTYMGIIMTTGTVGLDSAPYSVTAAGTATVTALTPAFQTINAAATSGTYVFTFVINDINADALVFDATSTWTTITQTRFYVSAYAV